LAGPGGSRMYAVNAGDHDLLFILCPVLGTPEIIDCEPGNSDGEAFVLNCDDERGAAIVSIIRRRYKIWRLRCYHSSDGKNWNRV
jgi:hypothetical protein